MDGGSAAVAGALTWLTGDRKCNDLRKIPDGIASPAYKKLTKANQRHCDAMVVPFTNGRCI